MTPESKRESGALPSPEAFLAAIERDAQSKTNERSREALRVLLEEHQKLMEEETTLADAFGSIPEKYHAVLEHHPFQEGSRILSEALQSYREAYETADEPAKVEDARIINGILAVHIRSLQAMLRDVQAAQAMDEQR